MYNGVWSIRTYNEGYIIIYNLRIYPCRRVYVPLTVYFLHTHEDILVAVFFAGGFLFFFFLTASTSAVNTIKHGNIYGFVVCSQIRTETFRRPEQLVCDLNQLGRSVKQVPSDDETFL